MALNVELAERVLARIDAEPGRFAMGEWVGLAHDGNGHVCGTTLCIAGHAMVESGKYEIVVDGYMGVPDIVSVSGKYSARGTYEEVAGKLLGILTDDDSDEEWAVLSDLFYEFDEDVAVARLREMVVEAKAGRS